MEEQKFERHDFLNGLALAGVLGVLVLLIVAAAISCSTSLGSVAQGEKKVVVSSTAAAEQEAEQELVAETPAKEPSEVTARVGNGANKSGLATSGTRLLAQSNYNMLQGRTKEGPLVETSAVFYNPGFAADAELMARLLSIEVDQVLPMPEDPGIPIDSANVVVILGEDAEF